ncbi:hypothetical protein M9980_02210 [Sphingomonas donggukensis]|uniref:PepSY domain-containing protein n=1 Tax=Sphingomonas donggukensis TaxID=2949093 RepID=A0ABY4TUK9_9SPHN|nr:hypothetical protein [Sphingomonas donggukensis]URW76067.1 hypothetical protein M9980_02210 [Sphingomonas donggukensis]
MRAHRYLVPIAVVVMAGVQVLWPGSIRPVANRPAVSDVAALPPAVHAKMTRFLDAQAILLPEPFPRRADPQPGAPRLGYGYREVAFFKLPLFAYRDLGFVLYDSDGARQRLVPLDEGYLKLLEKEAGMPLARGYVFPVWWHLWGWLVIAALAASLVSWLREQDDKRMAAGII